VPERVPNPRTPEDDSLIKGNNWFSGKLVDLVVHHTPTCTQMTRLISEEMDRPLPWFTRLKMRVHYLVCCYCEHYKEDLHYLRTVLRSVHERLETTSTEILPAEVKQRLKDALRHQS
jgi:hypothetical protein